jgi:hypothetical protein
MPSVVRRPLIVAAVLGLAFVAGTAPTQARGDDRSWEVAASVSNTSYSNESNIDDSLGFGLRAAYYFRAAHALEFAIEQATGDHTSLPGVEFDVLQYSFNYMHNYLLKRSETISPYIALGYGWLEADDGASSSDSSVVRIGGGARFFVSPRFAIRLDALVFHWNGDGGAIPRDSFYSFNLGVGASFVFGGGSRPAAGTERPEPPSAPPAPAPAPEPAPEPAPAPGPEPGPAPAPGPAPEPAPGPAPEPTPTPGPAAGSAGP